MYRKTCPQRFNPGPHTERLSSICVRPSNSLLLHLHMTQGCCWTIVDAGEGLNGAVTARRISLPLPLHTMYKKACQCRMVSCWSNIKAGGDKCRR